MELPRESVSAQVKRVIRSSIELIPPMVYVPLKMRKKGVRVAGRRLTTKKPTVQENIQRIVEADPVGFLIAVMQGQPLPVFRVTGCDNAFEVAVDFETPNYEARLNAAQFLASRATIEAPPTQKAPSKQHERTEWEAMIKTASEG